MKLFSKWWICNEIQSISFITVVRKLSVLWRFRYSFLNCIKEKQTRQTMHSKRSTVAPFVEPVWHCTSKYYIKLCGVCVWCVCGVCGCGVCVCVAAQHIGRLVCECSHKSKQKFGRIAHVFSVCIFFWFPTVPRRSYVSNVGGGGSKQSKITWTATYEWRSSKSNNIRAILRIP